MNSNAKIYDLEERSYIFARDVRVFVSKIQKTIANIEDGKQLIRSSGSQAANYIEANESLSKKDFYMRVKISRKEIKESILWLKLLLVEINSETDKERQRLLLEATELMKIYGAIITKSK